jgi:hypothetical protein
MGNSTAFATTFKQKSTLSKQCARSKFHARKENEIIRIIPSA